MARPSLVVSWFGGDLRCGQLSRCVPKVERTGHLRRSNMPWQVAGLSRGAAAMDAR